MLTKLFRFNIFKLVSFNVCGITLTSKKILETLEIVSETPLMEIDAFSIKYFPNSLSLISKLTIQVLSITTTFLTFSIVSTWH